MVKTVRKKQTSQKELMKSLQKYEVEKWIKKETLSNLSNFKLRELLNHLNEEWYDPKSVKNYNGPLVNPGKEIEGRNYGFNFLFLSSFTISMLQDCALGIENHAEKRILDIGSALGANAWKELLAGCRVTAYDISYQLEQTSKVFDQYVSKRTSEDLFENKLEKISGNILNVRTDHPELLGKLDLINAQNVIHFFSPKSCMSFGNIVYDLLKPGGKAFISAEAYQTLKADPTCLDLYYANKQSGNKFPGNMYYENTLGKKVATCFAKDEQTLFDMEISYKKEKHKQTGLDHKFDIETLKYIFTEAHLEMEDAYYMVFDGDSEHSVNLVKYIDHPFAKFVGIAVTKPLDELVVNDEF